MIKFLDYIHLSSFIILFISFIALFINSVRVMGLGRHEINEDNVEKLKIVFKSKFNQTCILLIFLTIILLSISSFYIKDILKSKFKSIYNSKNLKISEQDIKTLEDLNINFNELKSSTELGRNESSSQFTIEISNNKEVLKVRLVEIRQQQNKFNLYIDDFRYSESNPIAAVYKK